jgi:hypothetical protein
MIHSDAFKVYYFILEFVFKIKLIESKIKEKHLFFEDSIFVGFQSKIIPSSGDIIINDHDYFFRFHGNGISITSIEHKNYITYNYYSNGSLSISFTSLNLANFIKYVCNNEIYDIETIEIAIDNLIKIHLLAKVWPEYGVYYLK